jgi:tetratricopeptide (TPR) repeat protein
VPRLLSHLNLNRELFYKRFKFFFVFLVPTFVLKYVSRRAPDFFDWRSGVLKFPADAETARREYERLYFSVHYNGTLTWSPAERSQKIVEIQTWLDEPESTLEHKANLLLEQASLFIDFEEYEAAIDAYDKALEIRPDDDHVWHTHGNLHDVLGRKEEAIASYDKALEIKPDDDHVWYDRGNSHDVLGRKEEAIASYDKALEIRPDFDPAWNNRGYSLHGLGRKEEAIASYDKALEIRPGSHHAFYNKARCYASQNQIDLAIDCLQQAIALDPIPMWKDKAKTDTDFDLIRDSDGFRALMEE